jgi:hypothetical protein
MGLGTQTSIFFLSVDTYIQPSHFCTHKNLVFLLLFFREFPDTAYTVAVLDAGSHGFMDGTLGVCHEDPDVVKVRQTSLLFL